MAFGYGFGCCSSQPSTIKETSKPNSRVPNP